MEKEREIRKGKEGKGSKHCQDAAEDIETDREGPASAWLRGILWFPD